MRASACLALGDVDDRHQHGLARRERDPARIGQHLDLAAVSLEMAPGAIRRIGVGDRARRLAMDVPPHGAPAACAGFAGRPT
jgi:hypothetical protein